MLGGGPTYVNHMLAIYTRVASIDTQNFKGARIPVPTNLFIDTWRSLATNPYHLGGVAPTEMEAKDHFGHLQDLLSTLGMQEAKHKAPPASQRMTWLGLQCDTLDMMVAIPNTQATGAQQHGSRLDASHTG